jgi:hypothetical protein
MCCLPNKFPLPVYLLINKCDKIDRVKRRPWLEKIQIENYITENQYYNHFFISATNELKDTRDTLQSTLSTSSVDVESPLRDIIKTILNFKDLRDKLLGINASAKISKANTKETKYTNTTKKSEGNLNLSRKGTNESKKKCFIL